MQGAVAPRFDAVDAVEMAQEIADLKAALTNQAKLTETAERERRKTVRRLDLLKTTIATMREQAGQATEEIEGLKADIASAEADKEEIEEERDALADRYKIEAEDVYQLVRVRDILKKGERAVALIEVERILDRCGGLWRTAGANVGQDALI